MSARVIVTDAEERAVLDLWLDHGWVDTFRAVHGDVTGAYTEPDGT